MIKILGVCDGIYNRESPFEKRVLMPCAGLATGRSTARSTGLIISRAEITGEHVASHWSIIYAQRLTPDVVVFFDHD
jgi:hypothetical protein